ncbi:MAG TPA: hypothetical protein VN622_04470 [Clostridia bacterium]|nr:hypothetical protein [Clostridia bacterium]
MKLYACLLISEWLASDNAKLLLFIVLCVVVFAGSRLFLKARNRTGNEQQGFGSAGDFASFSESADSHKPGRPNTSVHPTMRVGNLEIRKFYLANFDAMTGPPDPFEFADELTVEIEHVGTGNRSTWQFTVGTPAGFARLLENQKWESFYSPQVFVVRKYELEMVREMVMEHISSELEGGASLSDAPRPPQVSS